MKSKISKLLLISAKNGRSHTVLTELIGKYKDASGVYNSVSNNFFCNPLLFYFDLFHNN